MIHKPNLKALRIQIWSINITQQHIAYMHFNFHAFDLRQLKSSQTLLETGDLVWLLQVCK